MREQPRIIGKIKAIWKRLADRDYREAYVAGKVANDIAFQVYHLREHRGWTQGELARRADTKQPAISGLERSVRSVNVGTLLKVARAFNVGLSIRFVPFSRLVAEGVGDEISGMIPEFEDDFIPLPLSQLHRAATSGDHPAILLKGAGASGLLFGETEAPVEDRLIIRKLETTGYGENRYVH